MNPSNSFIQDDRAFEEARTRAKEVFILDSGLPDQIFQDSYRWFAFEEFLWTMSADFWTSIQELAGRSQDKSLTMAVLDPDPQNYYKKEFGYYNWVNIPLSISGEQYWNLLNEHPPDSPADSLLANSETIIWLPHSHQWAIWGERSYGICALGCREFAPVDSWHDLDWALNSGLPNNFAHYTVPNEFRQRLRQSYENRK